MQMHVGFVDFGDYYIPEDLPEIAVSFHPFSWQNLPFQMFSVSQLFGLIRELLTWHSKIQSQ